MKATINLLGRLVVQHEPGHDQAVLNTGGMLLPESERVSIQRPDGSVLTLGFVLVEHGVHFVNPGKPAAACGRAMPERVTTDALAVTCHRCITNLKEG